MITLGFVYIEASLFKPDSLTPPKHIMSSDCEGAYEIAGLN